MKKISTYLFRLSFLSILFMAFSASAEEYKSMIRYDRIWECVSYENGEDVIKCMRFDGSEEINGKTYHRIVTFRKTISNYVDDHFEYDTKDDVWEHEGFMREEDGEVYTLIQRYKDEFGEYLGYLHIPDSDNANVEGVEICEQKIYDFNCNAGYSYEGLSFVMKDGQECCFTVKDTDLLDVKGETYRKLSICPLEFKDIYPDLSYSIVEGIGAVTNGCLNYHEFITGVDMIWYHKCLSRLFDLEGNLIYNTNAFPHHNFQQASFASVENVDSDPDKNYAPIFDVLGRRISSPAPGQLYIQDGKKHIAR